ncbi:hypothetical protein R3W88_028958 [Solanum pinnatisectum]|uniref:TPD1 protein homolog 1-like n=1 Tax=Solanum pinnatisectum TaxID=50273 RepID=A0AAV9K4D8_9SOLN|nr:hypothetical protein R3W88_028958 [Solanum pinnatisectum]
MQTNHALSLVKGGDNIIQEFQDDRKANRVKPLPGLMCTEGSILINQGPAGTLPSGIPLYVVIIQNMCVAKGCGNIHMTCGWFSSARLINPKIFRRLGKNDCLVNDGKPLGPGSSLTFAYANTFPYHIAVKSVTCN